MDYMEVLKRHSESLFKHTVLYDEEDSLGFGTSADLYTVSSGYDQEVDALRKRLERAEESKQLSQGLAENIRGDVDFAATAAGRFKAQLDALFAQPTPVLIRSDSLRSRLARKDLHDAVRTYVAAYRGPLFPQAAISITNGTDGWISEIRIDAGISADFPDLQARMIYWAGRYANTNNPRRGVRVFNTESEIKKLTLSNLAQNIERIEFKLRGGTPFEKVNEQEAVSIYERPQPPLVQSESFAYRISLKKHIINCLAQTTSVVGFFLNEAREALPKD